MGLNYNGHSLGDKMVENPLILRENLTNMTKGPTLLMKVKLRDYNNHFANSKNKI